MSGTEHTIFTAIGFGTVVTVTQFGKVFRLAEDDAAVSVPLELAVQIAAETLLFLLDEPGIRNHREEGLAEYLGDSDENELRHILSRVSNPDGRTFTAC